MDIQAELENIIKIKQGDKDLALFYFSDEDGGGDWRLSIGNSSGYVLLGEIPGEIEFDGPSIKDVIIKVKNALSATRKGHKKGHNND